MNAPPHTHPAQSGPLHATAADDHMMMAAKHLYASGFRLLLAQQYMAAHEAFLEVFTMLRGMGGQRVVWMAMRLRPRTRITCAFRHDKHVRNGIAHLCHRAHTQGLTLRIACSSQQRVWSSSPSASSQATSLAPARTSAHHCCPDAIALRPFAHVCCSFAPWHWRASTASPRPWPTCITPASCCHPTSSMRCTASRSA